MPEDGEWRARDAGDLGLEAGRLGRVSQERSATPLRSALSFSAASFAICASLVATRSLPMRARRCRARRNSARAGRGPRRTSAPSGCPAGSRAGMDDLGIARRGAGPDRLRRFERRSPRARRAPARARPQGRRRRPRSPPPRCARSPSPSLVRRAHAPSPRPPSYAPVFAARRDRRKAAGIVRGNRPIGAPLRGRPVLKAGRDARRVDTVFTPMGYVGTGQRWGGIRWGSGSAGSLRPANPTSRLVFGARERCQGRTSRWPNRPKGWVFRIAGASCRL